MNAWAFIWASVGLTVFALLADWWAIVRLKQQIKRRLK